MAVHDPTHGPTASDMYANERDAHVEFKMTSEQQLEQGTCRISFALYMNSPKILQLHESETRPYERHSRLNGSCRKSAKPSANFLDPHLLE
jgi:hypothetical protein